MTEITNLKNMIWEKAKRPQLANYVWDAVLGPQMGYSFSDIHSMSYSFIGFQSAYIPSKWNPIFWNTACLIINSGMVRNENNEATKEKQTDYAKNAKALCKMVSEGINISLVDINKSDFTFIPNIETNKILFGMQALSHINADIVKLIIKNRPYKSFEDFLVRCPLNKSAMISLIKAGAFDKLMEDWSKETNIEPRILAMGYYLSKNCDAKKKITLQNFNGLIQRDLIPQSLKLQIEVFNFNKYLKDYRKYKDYYAFDDISMNFYSKNFDADYLEVIKGVPCIQQTIWNKIYKDNMDKARDWIKDNQTKILLEYNGLLFKEAWDKYAKGTISSWEMESLCFYYHNHELASVDSQKYGISDFNQLPENPIIEKTFKRGKNIIPIFKTYKIIGTVISKDDNRSSISILTPNSGVVNVKFTKEYYAMYSRQISEKQEDGTKKVLEKGWMTRGTKIMCTGFRREDTFVCKSYKHTPTHQLYKITELQNNGKDMILEHNRVGQQEE